MKSRRLIFIGGSLLIAAVAACLAMVFYWQQSQPVFKDAPKLPRAVLAFAQSQKARGQPLPESVSLRELVSGGFLSTNDVRAFDGMEVKISLKADEKYPQTILVHVRMKDGTQLVVLADGSVQQFAK